MTGMTKSVNRVVAVNPKAIATPKGARNSDPEDREKAMGRVPRMVVRAVSRMARRRVVAPCKIASRLSTPRLINWLM